MKEYHLVMGETSLGKVGKYFDWDGHYLDWIVRHLDWVVVQEVLWVEV